MSKRDYRILFEDMLESIEKIFTYTQGFQFEDFAVNSLVLDAVVIWNGHVFLEYEIQ